MSNSMSQSQRSLSFSFSDMIPEKGESEFDTWLQIKYLPSGFKIDNHDIENIQKQQRWLRRLRCDMRELCHMSAFKIIILWILSIFIFINYVTGQCYLDRNKDLFKNVNGTENITSVMASSTTTDISITNLNHSQSHMLLLRNILFRSIQSSSKTDCLVLTVFSLVDFVASHIFMLLLLFYVLHFVEVTPNFPWFCLEIVYALFYMFLIFLLALAVCITTKEIIIVVLALIQCIFAMFYILKKYYQLKSGRQPQDMSDDIDGDYDRRMKNMFHLKSPEETYRKNKFLQQEQLSINRKEFNYKSNKMDMLKNINLALAKQSKHRSPYQPAINMATSELLHKRSASKHRHSNRQSLRKHSKGSKSITQSSIDYENSYKHRRSMTRSRISSVKNNQLASRLRSGIDSRICSTLSPSQVVSVFSDSIIVSNVCIKSKDAIKTNMAFSSSLNKNVKSKENRNPTPSGSQRIKSTDIKQN